MKLGIFNEFTEGGALVELFFGNSFSPFVAFGAGCVYVLLVGRGVVVTIVWGKWL